MNCYTYYFLKKNISISYYNSNISIKGEKKLIRRVLSKHLNSTFDLNKKTNNISFLNSNYFSKINKQINFILPYNYNYTPHISLSLQGEKEVGINREIKSTLFNNYPFTNTLSSLKKINIINNNKLLKTIDSRSDIPFSISTSIYLPSTYNETSIEDGNRDNEIEVRGIGEKIFNKSLPLPVVEKNKKQILSFYKRDKKTANYTSMQYLKKNTNNLFSFYSISFYLYLNKYFKHINNNTMSLTNSYSTKLSKNGESKISEINETNYSALHSFSSPKRQEAEIVKKKLLFSFYNYFKNLRMNGYGISFSSPKRQELEFEKNINYNNLNFPFPFYNIFYNNIYKTENNVNILSSNIYHSPLHLIRERDKEVASLVEQNKELQIPTSVYLSPLHGDKMQKDTKIERNEALIKQSEIRNSIFSAYSNN